MVRALVLLLMPLVVACLRPPDNLAGQYAPVTVQEAQAEPREGVAVRWGGKLVSMQPASGQTCFEIASFPLDAKARPQPSDESPGRFVACAPGFYEPAVYKPGRDVTVVGALNGTTAGKVGQYDYTFPRVDATTVYLWPERPAQEAPAVWWPSVGISIGGVFWR
jgi:outer membrane lipoprotein